MSGAEVLSSEPFAVPTGGDQVESVSPSSSSKFCITWLADSAHSQRHRASPDQTTALLSTVTSGKEEWSPDYDRIITMNSDPVVTAGPANTIEDAYTGDLDAFRAASDLRGSLKYPVLARATSMPLPSQLYHLQNPHRTSGQQSRLSTISQSPEPVEASHLHELSLELADAVQTVVQTMLQIAPSQLLDPAKEQFSACSLSVPTPSMSAMFTTMKNLNYISANMSKFCSTVDPPPPALDISANSKEMLSHNSPSDFDLGEMLQSVGDALSGAAAEAGVDVVLFHGDVGLKHVYARGNEGGLSYALSHVIRQVLSTAQRGDTIEIGLFISALPPRSENPEASESREESMSPSPHDELRCTFEVAHKFSVPEFAGKAVNGDQADQNLRKSPNLSSFLLHRLLQLAGASLEANLPPKRFQYGRTCELGTTLEAGVPPSHNGSESSDSGTSSEPTLEELQQFAEMLRGNKVTLHASVKGSFAHHLTSYLTAWGLDVSHVSSDYEEGGSEDLSPVGTSESLSRSDPNISISSTQSRFPTSASAPHQTAPDAPSPQSLSSFVIIDDDLNALRQRLQEMRSDPFPPTTNSAPRKRPSLSAHHRPRSSPHVVRAMGHPPPPLPTAPIVILHFTSLSNYKNVKQTIQSAVANFSSSSTPVPEILIIPKPAGPRRFLTALHTAVTRPVVDPFFVPIATSPMSPGLHSHSFFQSFQGSPSPRSPNSRPAGTRSNSDRSSRSDYPSASSHIPPSPLAMSENIEYFSDPSIKLGSSPSSGFVIQSPDGQPAGIFFHPRVKKRNNSGNVQMERDRAQVNLTGSSDRRPGVSRSGTSPRLSTPRRPSESLQTVPFSALHKEQTSTQRLPSSQLIPPPSIGLGLDIGDSLGHVSQARRPALLIEEKPHSAPSIASSTGNPAIARKASDTPKSPQESTNPPQPRRANIRRVTPESKPSPPVASTAAPTPKPTMPAKKGKANDGNVIPPISVLVVDDNPINQTILTTFMRKKKIKYDVAMNGQEAVQKWRTGGFHLILMDIQMPVMDGIQATKEIRRMERTNAQAGYPPSPCIEDGPSPCPTLSDISGDPRGSPYRSSVIIVALTASSLQSDRVAALAAGCNDFLTKPVSLLWLNNKIIEWGSIKALQMWADLRPDVAKTIASGQEAKAQDVADRLHVPKGRRTPSPTNRSPGQSAIALSNAGNLNAPRPLKSPSIVPVENPLTATIRAPSISTSSQPPLQSGPSIIPEEQLSEDTAHADTSVPPSSLAPEEHR